MRGCKQHIFLTKRAKNWNVEQNLQTQIKKRNYPKTCKKQKLDEMKKLTNLKSENGFHQTKLPERLIKKMRTKAKKWVKFKNETKKQIPNTV